MKPETPVVLAMMVSSLSPAAVANEREELLTLKNTTLNLIQALVQQGVLDKNKAQQLVEAAEQKAAVEAKQQLADEAKAQAAEAVKSAKPKNDKSVRVAYVPDFIKEEIRQQVRTELKDDVVKEVKAHAKEEKWGVPAALPDWVNRFKLTGDVRLRGEGDFFPSSNPANDAISLSEGRFERQPWSYANWSAINNGASLDDIREQSNSYLNTSEDVNRFRMRLRLGLEAQITDSLKAGVRLATSNFRSPISTNQTLGQTGQQYEFALDRGFLQYDYVDAKGTEWLTLWAGRTINPWLSTDNVFDSDVGFEGLTGTVRLPLPGGDKSYTPPPPNARYGTNMGFSRPNSVFLTSGIYPLEEFQLSSNDKWLWGSQVGMDLLFRETSRVKFGLAYYDYRNTEAIPNTPSSDGVAGDLGDRNYTATQFMQKGNTLMQINTSGAGGDVVPTRVGLASGFSILDAVAVFDYAGFGDNHVILTADYAKNLGFDAGDILRRAARVGGLNGIVNYGDLRERTTAWQVRLDVGRPEIKKLYDWNFTFAYKYVERDAVLDAFTDSDFHLGGTDAKGWVMGASYGIARNTWLNARWMTADQIDGPKYGIDVLMVDLNSRF